MNDVAIVLCVLACACALWAVVAAIRIGGWLSRHGVKVNWVFYRGLMPWYVHRYRTMTREAEGRVGGLFPQFVVPINLAWVFGVAAVIAALAGGR